MAGKLEAVCFSGLGGHYHINEESKVVEWGCLVSISKKTSRLICWASAAGFHHSKCLQPVVGLLFMHGELTWNGLCRVELQEVRFGDVCLHILKNVLAGDGFQHGRRLLRSALEKDMQIPTALKLEAGPRIRAKIGAAQPAPWQLMGPICLLCCIRPLPQNILPLLLLPT